jgi:catechol 2,3-dioxygenase-like lactoylglutathione lyase family enzyme
MVGVVGLHHVNVNVADLGEALTFYVEQLGFAVVPERPDFGFAGAWLQMGNHQLHLVESADFTVDPRQHFALQVADIEASAAHLDAVGVEYKGPLAIPGAGRQIFLRDPSGNRIELNQPGG